MSGLLSREVDHLILNIQWINYLNLLATKFVCLPVSHCELNPIEMAWSQIKEYIRTHNTLFTLSEMERLTHAGFDVVTPMRWKSLIAHVQTKTEDHYWDVDGLQLDLVEEFIISTERNLESELESEDDLSSGFRRFRLNSPLCPSILIKHCDGQTANWLYHAGR